MKPSLLALWIIFLILILSFLVFNILDKGRYAAIFALFSIVIGLVIGVLELRNK